MNQNEARPAKTVAAVHDLSCVGRCALTIVIPTLAAMGAQPVPLPTAVLSTNTGAFSDMAVQDMSGFMTACVAHWRRIGLRLDAVYSGYLADARQVDVVRGLIDWQKGVHGTLAVVDPAMGDNGRLYSAVPADMPAAMRRLCDAADVITPNITEAALMLGEPYTGGPMSDAALFRLLDGFSAGCTVLTSARLADGEHANVFRRRGEAGFWVCPYRRVDASCHGTGDLFASVLTGALIGGRDMARAVSLAGEFVRHVIERTRRAGGEAKYGVQLEPSLGWLMSPPEPAEAARFVRVGRLEKGAGL